MRRLPWPLLDGSHRFLSHVLHAGTLALWLEATLLEFPSCPQAPAASRGCVRLVSSRLFPLVLPLSHPNWAEQRPPVVGEPWGALGHCNTGPTYAGCPGAGSEQSQREGGARAGKRVLGRRADGGVPRVTREGQRAGLARADWTAASRCPGSGTYMPDTGLIRTGRCQPTPGTIICFPQFPKSNANVLQKRPPRNGVLPAIGHPLEPSG